MLTGEFLVLRCVLHCIGLGFPLLVITSSGMTHSCETQIAIHVPIDIRVSLLQALILTGDVHFSEVCVLHCIGRGYPLFVITSSGMTHSWKLQIVHTRSDRHTCLTSVGAHIDWRRSLFGSVCASLYRARLPAVRHHKQWHDALVGDANWQYAARQLLARQRGAGPIHREPGASLLGHELWDSHVRL